MVPIPQTDNALGPAPHHPIISEDTSVSNDDHNPDDASSFDSPILFKPEGDVWVDHGGPNNGLVSDNSAASAPPISSSSEKTVSWDDVVVDKPYSQEGASTLIFVVTQNQVGRSVSSKLWLICMLYLHILSASYGLLPFNKENEVSAAHGTMC